MMPGLTMPPVLLAKERLGLRNRWTVAANMPEARSGHVAVPLSDGRVLVCGGEDSSSRQRTTWIYDPSTNIWSSVANMPEVREGHAAAPLNDGRVLVCAGVLASSNTNTARIYNPATNSWSNAANMPETRYLPAAAPLKDGRVLVCGGFGGPAPPGATNNTWIYNPATNNWSNAANMPEGRHGHAAALLPDGRVLVCGGVGGSLPITQPFNTTWIYDPSTNSWSNAANMPGVNAYHAAVPLLDGRVLVCGGVGFLFASSTTRIYNPSTNSWSSVANMPGARAYHAAAPLSDGRVLVCGGADSSSVFGTTWIYG